jgi:hypothetical protein
MQTPVGQLQPRASSRSLCCRVAMNRLGFVRHRLELEYGRGGDQSGATQLNILLTSDV